MLVSLKQNPQPESGSAWPTRKQLLVCAGSSLLVNSVLIGAGIAVADTKAQDEAIGQHTIKCDDEVTFKLGSQQVAAFSLRAERATLSGGDPTIYSLGSLVVKRGTDEVSMARPEFADHPLTLAEIDFSDPVPVSSMKEFGFWEQGTLWTVDVEANELTLSGVCDE